MRLDQNATVSIGKLIMLAQDLKSEHGENPEYDRALVELITDAASLSMDLKHEVAKQLGVRLKKDAG